MGNERRATARLKLFDVIIVAVAALFSVALSVRVYGGSAPSHVVVTSGSEEWIYPLSEDRTVEVEGPLGPTTIGIENGAAHFEDSPCRNKTCVAAAAIRRAGEWSACLPNGVFIRIEGAYGDEDIDAVVR